jgi:hypothetical protein
MIFFGTLPLVKDGALSGTRTPAVTAGHDAVTGTPPDTPTVPGSCPTLGAALQIRFGSTGQLADLDEAVTNDLSRLGPLPPHRPLTGELGYFNRDPGGVTRVVTRTRVLLCRCGGLNDHCNP